MKKIVSILLTVILLSCCITTAFAASENKDQSIKEKLIQTYFSGDNSIENYEELYFHKNQKAELDWALIYVTTYSGTDEMIYRKLGDIVIEQDHGDIPFEVGYAIYDYENDKFYDIIEVWDSDQYEDLREVFTNVYLKQDPNHDRYFDKLYDQYEYLVPEEEIEKYDELYYHTNSKGEIDWALVYIYYDCIFDTVIVRGVLGGKTIYLPGPEYPFTTGYGLYDVAKGQFYDLWNNTLFDQYDGLFEVWQSIDTSEIEPEKYLGDANGDNTMDIIDATYIQRYLISRVSKYEIAKTAADVDNDGEVTILDTTRIQRALVGVCSLG